MIRLQTRLFLTLISVALVALAIVALFALQATRRQFDEYVVRDQIIVLNQTAQLFTEPIRAGAAAELDSLAAEIVPTYGITATVYDEEGLIVAASDPAEVGQTVTDVPLPSSGLAVQLVTADKQTGTVHFYTTPANDALPPIMVLQTTGDVSAGTVFDVSSMPAPSDRPGLPPGTTITQDITLPQQGAASSEPLPAMVVNTAASQDTFLSLVNRAFLAAMGVSLLVAVMLSWLTSRRILRPVQALTAATRQMGQGDLSARVPVKGRDELAELGQSFNQMAEDMTHQEQLRRNLVTDVAHELLTPLTAVRGHLEAVQDGILAPTPDLIDSLHDEVMLLDELIAELQDLSLAEAGQLRLDLQPVAVVDVLMGAITAVTPQLAAKNLTLTTNLPDDLPLVEMDIRRMGQVFRNLLVNAVKYTLPGGQVAISARQEGPELWVIIRDTGQGIAPEHLPRIFDRFYRADPSRARETGGSGLGLAIVKSVVQAHHGRVWAESEPGIGSTFTLSLPLQQPNG
jgi:signal transduction histidine kinase